MIFIPKRATLLDPLDIALWEIHGWRNDRVTMSRPGNVGPLILAHDGVSADATQVGLALIGSSMTDGLVRAEILIKGWNTSVDITVGGPALRIAGTNGVSDQKGYYGYIRNFSSSSRRAGTRKNNVGSPGNIGTETASLPSSWVDGSTHLEMEIEASGTSITTRAKIKGAGSWARDATVTDTSITAAGKVGIICAILPLGMSIEIHNFEVIPV